MRLINRLQSDQKFMAQRFLYSDHPVFYNNLTKIQRLPDFKSIKKSTKNVYDAIDKSTNLTTGENKTRKKF